MSCDLGYVILSKFLNLCVPLESSLITELLGHKVRGFL